MVMKAHFTKNGLRIVLHFTNETLQAFLEEMKKLEASGWTQVPPEFEEEKSDEEAWSNEKIQKEIQAMKEWSIDIGNSVRELDRQLDTHADKIDEIKNMMEEINDDYVPYTQVDKKIEEALENNYDFDQIIEEKVKEFLDTEDISEDVIEEIKRRL